MSSEIIKYYLINRQIFGICTHCGEIFRLSDCKVYLKKKPRPDWLDLIELESNRLETKELRLEEKKEQIRKKARIPGRKAANKEVRRIDSVFTPRKLNPDDAKVIFHPVDYLVFNGMKEKVNIKNVIFLDREDRNNIRVQNSIEKAVSKEKYEWQTLRVDEAGEVKAEE